MYKIRFELIIQIEFLITSKKHDVQKMLFGTKTWQTAA